MPKITSFAPQFLVEDLDRSIAFYEKLGFRFGKPWEDFYAEKWPRTTGILTQ